MHNRLIASSPTKEGIISIINQYFYRDDVELFPVLWVGKKEAYKIRTLGMGVFNDYLIVKQGKRFRFEEITGE